MVSFKLISYDSVEYVQAVALREEILRKPLGLSFTQAELEQEKNHIHVAGFLDGILCATAALVPERQRLKMQRVVVRSDLQGKGIGSSMMAYCEDYAHNHDYTLIYLHARAGEGRSAVSFYLKNNYLCEGIPFDEDGIPHQKMTKSLIVI